jgi:hypothetical protein
MSAIHLTGSSVKVRQLIAAISRALNPQQTSLCCTGLSFTANTSNTTSQNKATHTNKSAPNFTGLTS